MTKVLIVDNYYETGDVGELRVSVEACSTPGSDVRVIKYSECSVSSTRGLDPDCLVLSGSSALLSREGEEERYRSEIGVIGSLGIPTLGICLGHQLVGMAYGAVVKDIGRAIRGYMEVDVLVNDPLFSGLPKRIVVTESHREEVKGVPPSFVHLARSRETENEAMRRSDALIYGVQFHPERYDEQHPHGGMVLRNFFRSVKR